MVTSKQITASASALEEHDEDNLHYVRRGEILERNAFASEVVEGYDVERMRARASLTAEEEKKLLRRIDWHLMPLCSVMFLLKNIDADNVCVFGIYIYIYI